MRYYHPDEFAEMKAEALALGFRHVESAPLVRSSYHARDQVPGAELKALPAAGDARRRRPGRPGGELTKTDRMTEPDRGHNERNESSRRRLVDLASRLGADELALEIDDTWTVGALLGHLAFWDRLVEARWKFAQAAGNRDPDRGRRRAGRHHQRRRDPGLADRRPASPRRARRDRGRGRRRADRRAPRRVRRRASSPRAGRGCSIARAIASSISPRSRPASAV